MGRKSLPKVLGAAIAYAEEGFPVTDLVAWSNSSSLWSDQKAAQGHQVTPLGAFSGAVGGGQAVMRDFASRVNYGASDPRKDGAAIPEPVRGAK